MSYKPGYGIEDFIDDLKDVISENLNTYIADLNTVKDDFDLSTIDDNAYYVQTLNDSHVNYNDFVFIFEETVTAEGIGPGVSETYTVIASIVSNYGNDEFNRAYKKQLRYREILKAILLDKWNEMSRPGQIKVSSLTPFGVTGVNSSKPQVGVGISLEVTFAP